MSASAAASSWASCAGSSGESGYVRGSSMRGR
jgi:hypothetical protein